MLVLGAAGGVGHLAVQVAKARGAYVIGTASADKHDFLRGLGTDEAIDRAADIAKEARDIDVVLDVVLDLVGGTDRLRSLDTLGPGGVLVSSLPVDFDEVTRRAAELGVRATNIVVEHERAAMTGIATLAGSGRPRAHIAGTYPLAEVAKAHMDAEAGGALGKPVLTVRPWGPS